MIRFLLCSLFLFALLAGSCRKETFTTDPGAQLSFSTDSVKFDTIFTSVGSATHNFMVFNTNPNALRMDISLAGGESSPFRINIDGRATTHFKDYELAGKDSMFIFAEVTIDPNSGNPPLVLDSIMFDYNGNHQRVILVAFGQDVHLITDSVLTCGAVWTKDKPYLIYSGALVPKGCKLTVQQGTQVYSHKGAYLFVQGQLEVNGTADEPVVFSGDRREKKYSTTAGQWGGIWFLSGSNNNTITHAIVENADNGIKVDSLPDVSTGYNLKIEKSIIRNMASIGLWGQSSTIYARNVLVHSCGQFTFLGDFGGNYNFLHCTLDNSFFTANRKLPSVVLTNRDIPTYPPNNIHGDFRNSIIWGSLDDEVGFDLSGHGTNAFLFDHNILKIKDTKITDPTNILNTWPKFKSYQDGNYQLDTLSLAINAGAWGTGDFYEGEDLVDKPRVNLPDIGCFERE